VPEHSLSAAWTYSKCCRVGCAWTYSKCGLNILEVLQTHVLHTLFYLIYLICEGAAALSYTLGTLLGFCMHCLHFGASSSRVPKVGQNRIYTPHMTVCTMISLPKKPYVHRICIYGWPEPYMYTVYDGIFDDFPAKITVCTPYMYLWLARIVYIHRIWPFVRWFPCQKYRMYTVYVFMVGQNRICTLYMTVYLMISLPKIPYVHRIYSSGQLYMPIEL